MNEADFQERWREAEPRLRSRLRRDMQSADVDDVLQMTAIEALVTDKVFTNQAHFFNWCRRVASNKKIDDVRKLKHEDIRELPAIADTRDVGDEVVSRLKLAAVKTAIESVLPPAERAAIRDAGVPEPDRVAANRKGVARMRAREKLRPIYESAAFAPLRAAASVSRRLLDGVGPGPAAAGAAAAAVAIASLLGAPSGTNDRAAVGPADRSHRAAPSLSGLIDSARVVDRVGADVRAAAATAAHLPSTFHNYTPIPAMHVPFIPAADGSPQTIDLRPTGEKDQGNLFCGKLLILADRCFRSPLPSIDSLFGPQFPHPFGP